MPDPPPSSESVTIDIQGMGAIFSPVEITIYRRRKQAFIAMLCLASALYIVVFSGNPTHPLPPSLYLSHIHINPTSVFLTQPLLLASWLDTEAPRQQLPQEEQQQNDGQHRLPLPGVALQSKYRGSPCLPVRAPAPLPLALRKRKP